MTIANPYSPPKSPVETTSGVEAAPPLWNPNAAASWSLIFSPIFGAVLHMKNWQALGRQDEAERARKWVIGLIVFFVLLLVGGALLPDTKAVDGTSRLLGFAVLLSWYYSRAKPQAAYVLAKYGKDYPRRGWARPLGAAVGILVAFMAVVFAIAFVAGLSETRG